MIASHCNGVAREATQCRLASGISAAMLVACTGSTGDTHDGSGASSGTGSTSSAGGADLPHMSLQTVPQLMAAEFMTLSRWLDSCAPPISGKIVWQFGETGTSGMDATHLGNPSSAERLDARRRPEQPPRDRGRQREGHRLLVRPKRAGQCNGPYDAKVGDFTGLTPPM
jgi:hypothetical protein